MRPSRGSTSKQVEGEGWERVGLLRGSATRARGGVPGEVKNKKQQAKEEKKRKKSNEAVKGLSN